MFARLHGQVMYVLGGHVRTHDQTGAVGTIMVLSKRANSHRSVLEAHFHPSSNFNDRKCISTIRLICRGVSLYKLLLRFKPDTNL